MRMLPTRYAGKAQPLMTKRKAAQIAHLSAPLKGLDLSSKIAGNSRGADRLVGPILKNWVIYEDRIQVRPGTKLMGRHAATRPVASLVPYFGATQQLAAATDGKLVKMSDMSTVIHGGFAGDDWSWTSFANLGETTYTIMVNGFDGVWSWDGTTMVKETVTAPTTAAWIDPDDFHIVMSHMNRLWFADQANLCIYYLPVQTKSGELKQLPLNAIFKRGGHIQAIYTWSMDGGAGIDDRIVIFTSNAECAIYSGVDPDSQFELIGIFRFDMPVSKHCVVNYGGDLYVLVSTGLVPMSTLLRAESESLGTYDQSVLSAFTDQKAYRNVPGWAVMLDHINGLMICNLPLGAAGKYKQMVRKMPTKYWTEWGDLPARSWGWINGKLYFGDDSGGVFEVNERYLNDNGKPITADVQLAWNDFGTASVKHFKMIKPYLLTDGVPRYYVDVRVDYDTSPPTNQPDATFVGAGTDWDVGDWDVDSWASGMMLINSWNGVAAYGTVGGVRFTVSITNCKLALAGFDVIYEEGKPL